MVLGPEQVITIFHNYLRSSVTKFRGSRWESMSPWSSVVQVTGVIGGVGHRSHRWCRSLGSSSGGCHSYKRYIDFFYGEISHLTTSRKLLQNIDNY